MRIIELLNMISKGEEVPKKIKYDNVIYEYVRMWEQYVDEETEKPLLKEISAYNYSGLNNEVEILDDEDEEKKIPDKILEDEFDELTKEGKLWKLFYKYNKLIDYLEKQRKGK